MKRSRLLFTFICSIFLVSCRHEPKMKLRVISATDGRPVAGALVRNRNLSYFGSGRERPPGVADSDGFVCGLKGRIISATAFHPGYFATDFRGIGDTIVLYPAASRTKGRTLDEQFELATKFFWPGFIGQDPVRHASNYSVADSNIGFEKWNSWIKSAP
jgi:hypothetical protein